MLLSQPSTRNRLLATLSADDYARVESHLKRVPLPLRFRLHDAGRTIEWIYFPEDGVGSIVTSSPCSKQVEAGIFGSEGMSATEVVLGSDCASYDRFMQIEGTSGLRIATADLKRAMAASGSLTARLLLYVQTVIIQSASSTAAAAGYSIEQRLARWLLMCHDRVEGDKVKLTNEFMSMMLGTRRSSVTTALKQLAARKLIVRERGRVTVINRYGLRAVADSSYGFAETEYDRLMGPHGARQS